MISSELNILKIKPKMTDVRAKYAGMQEGRQNEISRTIVGRLTPMM